MEVKGIGSKSIGGGDEMVAVLVVVMVLSDVVIGSIDGGYVCGVRVKC